MSLLDLPEGELAAVVSAACRTARYDEYLALAESAMEDYEDWNDRVRWLEGDDRAVGVQARDEAAARVSLYAGVATAYRPVIDPAALVERVVERLAELVRLVPAEVPRVLPVTAPKSPATPADRKVSYDPNPTVYVGDPDAYGAYARRLDDECPDWWRDDLSPMAPELATAARMRRAMWRPEGGEPR